MLFWKMQFINNLKLFFSSNLLKQFKCKTANEFIKVVDYFPYRKFLRTSSVERVTTFVKDLKERPEITQINLIQWCGCFRMISGFYPFWLSTVTDLYKCVSMTLKQETILEFIKETTVTRWDESLKNMLCSTILNEVLIKNQRNNPTVNPSFLKAYGRHFLNFFVELRVMNIVALLQLRQN